MPAGELSVTACNRLLIRAYSAWTCGFQILCFVFSATLTEYPAASAASLSFSPLSFPNKNNRCLSVRPFLSSDLRRSSCSSRVGGFGSSKSSGLTSCEIRCFIAALSETIRLSAYSDAPLIYPTRLLGGSSKNICQQFHPTPDLYSVSPSLVCVWPQTPPNVSVRCTLLSSTGFPAFGHVFPFYFRDSHRIATFGPPFLSSVCVQKVFIPKTSIQNVV